MRALALPLAEQQADIAHRHTIGGRVFAFDTKGIRKEPGDIPLSYVPVVQRIHELLAEILGALQGAQ